MDCTPPVLTLDRDDGAWQSGDTVFDLVAATLIRSGLHTDFGYGIDDDRRHVGLLQSTLNF